MAVLVLIMLRGVVGLVYREREDIVAAWEKAREAAGAARAVAFRARDKVAPEPEPAEEERPKLERLESKMSLNPLLAMQRGEYSNMSVIEVFDDL